MIVVDTNIIAYMTFSTPYSPIVSALYQKDPVWEAPLLWKSEFLNVLALHYRKGLVNYHEGLNALDFAERLIVPLMIVNLLYWQRGSKRDLSRTTKISFLNSPTLP